MTLPTTTVTANSHFCWRDRRSQTATAMTRLRMIAYWATREMSESIAAVYVREAKSRKPTACRRFAPHDHPLPSGPPCSLLGSDPQGGEDGAASEDADRLHGDVPH